MAPGGDNAFGKLPSL